MITDAEKTEFNERAKASMRVYLRSKSWVEKVESIARMNVADKLAKQAMREAMARGANFSSAVSKPILPNESELL